MPDFPDYYENIDEAQFRLQGTVVTYDGKPCYIQNIQRHRDGILRCYIVMLPNRIDRRYDDEFVEVVDDDDEINPDIPQAIRKKITSPKFNRFRPFPMGFVNFFRDYPKAKYLTRIPGRRSKQGLYSETFKVDHIDTRMADRGGFNTYVSQPEFRDCVVGEYPTFEEAMDTLRADTAIAVNREFAIERDNLGLNYLYHRLDKVGIARGREVLLADKFSFLREGIIECQNLPNNVGNL